jgi:hypothetical protein
MGGWGPEISDPFGEIRQNQLTWPPFRLAWPINSAEFYRGLHVHILGDVANVVCIAIRAEVQVQDPFQE